LNGKKATENIFRNFISLKNGTINTFASLVLRPGYFFNHFLLKIFLQ